MCNQLLYMDKKGKFVIWNSCRETAQQISVLRLCSLISLLFSFCIKLLPSLMNLFFSSLAFAASISMAHFCVRVALLYVLAAAAYMFGFVVSQEEVPPPLHPAEQEAVYRVLESVSSDAPWRELFPDDLCSSAPHGVVCDYLSEAAVPHVTELSFGFVSDYSPNPSCSPNATLNPSLLAPLSHLRKLFFYKCFFQAETPFPDFSALNRSSSLEELVLIENPALTGSLDGRIGNLRRLRRLVLTGTSVSGGVSDEIGELVDLEQLTLSRNKLEGEIPTNTFKSMKKLKVLDLSENAFEGAVPESIGYATALLKVDLSHNRFSGRIPQSFSSLKNVEFLDLSYNNFGSFGFPLGLGEMHSLKEVYLSGNFLGGEIPDIWGNLRGIMGIGLSSMGIVGRIPRSMGVHLKSACYIGLDNNMLQGVVPQELGSLEFVSELNLQNNNLSGRLPFSADFLSKLGGKLKVEGNSDLCIDGGLKSAKVSVNLGNLKVCRDPYVSKTALFHESSGPSQQHASSSALAFMAVGILGLRILPVLM